MKQKVISLIISMALVVFAMAAGAACYHQYLVKRGMLRTSPSIYIPSEFVLKGSG